MDSAELENKLLELMNGHEWDSDFTDGTTMTKTFVVETRGTTQFVSDTRQYIYDSDHWAIHTS